MLDNTHNIICSIYIHDNFFDITPAVPSFILNLSNQLVTGSCVHDTAV